MTARVPPDEPEERRYAPRKWWCWTNEAHAEPQGFPPVCPCWTGEHPTWSYRYTSRPPCGWGQSPAEEVYPMRAGYQHYKYLVRTGAMARNEAAVLDTIPGLVPL